MYREVTMIEVREVLRYASIATTLNIYTHVVDASHRRAIEALEHQLFPTVPKLASENTAATAGSLGDAAVKNGGAVRI